MTNKQIIIDDQKKTIHRLQQECTEKTNTILALGDKLKLKEQECEWLQLWLPIVARIEKRFGNLKRAKDIDYLAYVEQIFAELDQLKSDNDSLKSELMQTNCYLEADKETIDQLKEENEGLKQRLHQCWKVEYSFVEQIDQLKGKNGELKKINNHIEHNRNQKADKLMRIEKLITTCSTGYTDEFIQELLVILHEPEPSSFENKYKSTLVEIKEVANYSFNLSTSELMAKLEQILQKINEVLE